MKKLLCKLFGHKWKKIGSHVYTNTHGDASTLVAGFVCFRCNKARTEYFDL